MGLAPEYQLRRQGQVLGRQRLDIREIRIQGPATVQAIAKRIFGPLGPDGHKVVAAVKRDIIQLPVFFTDKTVILPVNGLAEAAIAQIEQGFGARSELGMPGLA